MAVTPMSAFSLKSDMARIMKPAIRTTVVTQSAVPTVEKA